jgi:protein TonB
MVYFEVKLNSRVKAIDRYQQASRFSSLLSVALFVSMGVMLLLNSVRYVEPGLPESSTDLLELEIFEPAPEPVPIPEEVPIEEPIEEPKPEEVIEQTLEEPDPEPFALEPKPPPPEKPKVVKKKEVKPPTPVPRPASAANPAPTMVVGPTADEQNKFVSDFVRMVERNKYYPREAKRQGVTGQVKVRVSFSPDGAVTSVSLTGGDYPPILAQAATQTMLTVQKRWKPRPGAPPSLTVPISFIMN